MIQLFTQTQFQKVSFLLVNNHFFKSTNIVITSHFKLFAFITALIFSALSLNAVSATDSSSASSKQWKKFTVKSGDNLSTVFRRAGLSPQDVLLVSDSIKVQKTFVRMIPGETLSFLIDKGSLEKIRYAISRTTTLLLTKSFNNKTQSYFYILGKETKNQQPAISEKLPKPSTVVDIDELILIEPNNYSSIERKHFTVKDGQSLLAIFSEAGLSVTDVDNLENSVKKSNFASYTPFNSLSTGDSLSFLIVDDSLLELVHTNQNGVSTSATRTLEFKNIYAIQRAETQTQETPQIQVSLETALTESSKADNWVYYTVQPDDNLSTIFIRAGLSHTDVYYVNSAAEKERIFQRMMPGEKIAFLIRNGHLIKIKYIISPLKSVLLSRVDKAKYNVEVLERKPVTILKQVAGSINSSLFVDALNAGLSNSMTMNFAKVFAWDVDFSQDIQPGDKFKVVYEEITIDGKKIKDGNIVAAQFETGGQSLVGIFYRDTEGDVGFYSPEGRSMRKAFLRMPVEFARISSKFNLRRKHPIYNKIRAHKGVDYAAKRGTPIMASGNGKVIHLGRKGDYGKTIIIQHGSSINTLYAHMSGYSKKLKVGSRVKQGQLIGYVGATGAVTGAHLHYEFRVDGVHKNPLTVKLPKAITMDSNELDSFKQVAKAALSKLNFDSQNVISEQKIVSNMQNSKAQ